MTSTSITLPRRAQLGVGALSFPRLRSAPIAVLRILLDAGAFYFAAIAVGAAPPLAGIYGLVGLASTRRIGAQRARLLIQVSEELPTLASRIAIATVAAALLPFGSAWMAALPVAAVVAFGLLVLGRALAGAMTTALRQRGVGLEQAVLVGGGPIGIAMADVLRGRPEFGVDPIGFVEVNDVDHDLPTLGTPTDLVRILLGRNVRRVIVTFSGSRESELVDVLRDCGQLRFDHRIHVLPRFFELGVATDRNADDLWGFPLVPLNRPGPTAWTRRCKRALDVSVAALMLLLTAPVFAAIALAVRLTSPGPILFRQKRVGQYGQLFEILKFRTMLPNDDSETQWTVDEDDRVTAIGRFLRPTHLDELPQLINVLRGDMALVGPRPERPTFVDQFSIEHRGYEDRHRVPVGLTGWAQVNGLWGDTSIEDRARFDNAYIENWSLWRELSILFRTVPTLLGRRSDDEAAEPALEPVADDVVA